MGGINARYHNSSKHYKSVKNCIIVNEVKCINFFKMERFGEYFGINLNNIMDRTCSKIKMNQIYWPG